MAVTVTLGWWSADQLTGSLRELSEKEPDNKNFKALYDAFVSGSSEPITIRFNDEVEE